MGSANLHIAVESARLVGRTGKAWLFGRQDGVKYRGEGGCLYRLTLRDGRGLPQVADYKDTWYFIVTLFRGLWGYGEIGGL